MQGLHQLYGHTGRRAEWQALVEEIVPDFVDPATDGPLPGREEQWGLVTEYRVRLARGSAPVGGCRTLAARPRRMESPPRRAHTRCARCVISRSRRVETRSGDEKSLTPTATPFARWRYRCNELGDIQREQGKAECVDVYRRSRSDLLTALTIKPAEAITAFNLGTCLQGHPRPARSRSGRTLVSAHVWNSVTSAITGAMQKL